MASALSPGKAVQFTHDGTAMSGHVLVQSGDSIEVLPLGRSLANSLWLPVSSLAPADSALPISFPDECFRCGVQLRGRGHCGKPMCAAVAARMAEVCGFVLPRAKTAPHATMLGARVDRASLLTKTKRALPAPKRSGKQGEAARKSGTAKAPAAKGKSSAAKKSRGAAPTKGAKAEAAPKGSRAAGAGAQGGKGGRKRRRELPVPESGGGLLPVLTTDDMRRLGEETFRATVEELPIVILRGFLNEGGWGVDPSLFTMERIVAEHGEQRVDILQQRVNDDGWHLPKHFNYPDTIRAFAAYQDAVSDALAVDPVCDIVYAAGRKLVPVRFGENPATGDADAAGRAAGSAGSGRQRSRDARSDGTPPAVGRRSTGGQTPRTVPAGAPAVFGHENVCADAWARLASRSGGRGGPGAGSEAPLPTTWALNGPRRRFMNMRYAVNIDMGPWASQNAELRRRLPPWLLSLTDQDCLRFMPQHVSGVNVPQAYAKVPSVWTGGHEENNRFSSINCCHGPHGSEWGAIPAEHAARFRALVLQHEGVDVYASEGQWIPRPGFCEAHDVPVLRGRQLPGDIVVLRGSTFHWVVSLGKSLNTSWNFGSLRRWQMEAALARYDANLHLPVVFQNVVPMRHLGLRALTHHLCAFFDAVAATFGGGDGRLALAERAALDREGSLAVGVRLAHAAADPARLAALEPLSTGAMFAALRSAFDRIPLGVREAGALQTLAGFVRGAAEQERVLAETLLRRHPALRAALAPEDAVSVYCSEASCKGEVVTAYGVVGAVDDVLDTSSTFPLGKPVAVPEDAGADAVAAPREAESGGSRRSGRRDVEHCATGSTSGVGEHGAGEGSAGEGSAGEGGAGENENGAGEGGAGENGAGEGSAGEGGAGEIARGEEAAVSTPDAGAVRRRDAPPPAGAEVGGPAEVIAVGGRADGDATVITPARVSPNDWPVLETEVSPLPLSPPPAAVGGVSPPSPLGSFLPHVAVYGFTGAEPPRDAGGRRPDSACKPSDGPGASIPAGGATCNDGGLAGPAAPVVGSGPGAVPSSVIDLTADDESKTAPDADADTVAGAKPPATVPSSDPPAAAAASTAAASASVSAPPAATAPAPRSVLTSAVPRRGRRERVPRVTTTTAAIASTTAADSTPREETEAGPDSDRPGTDAESADGDTAGGQSARVLCLPCLERHLRSPSTSPRRCAVALLADPAHVRGVLDRAGALCDLAETVAMGRVFAASLDRIRETLRLVLAPGSTAPRGAVPAPASDPTAAAAAAAAVAAPPPSAPAASLPGRGGEPAERRSRRRRRPLSADSGEPSRGLGGAGAAAAPVKRVRRIRSIPVFGKAEVAVSVGETRAPQRTLAARHAVAAVQSAQGAVNPFLVQATMPASTPDVSLVVFEAMNRLRSLRPDLAEVTSACLRSVLLLPVDERVLRILHALPSTIDWIAREMNEGHDGAAGEIQRWFWLMLLGAKSDEK